MKPIQDSRDLFRCVVAPIGLIGIIHVLCGAAMIFEPTAAYITGVYGFGFMDPLLKGLLLIFVGALAVIARTGLVERKYEKAWIIPQQLILVWQLYGIAFAVWGGVYPNGHEPVAGSYWGSMIFIISDQMPWIMLCLSHTVELVFADCLLARVRNYYEARLKQEHEALMQAERQLAMHNETQFWMNLAR
jgi:hypothetical protein